MKVLLVSPPNEATLESCFPNILGEAYESRDVYPPLGLLYVASHAETVPGCEVRVLDCNAERLTHEAAEERIAASAPDVVGIQAMTFTLIDCIRLARSARRAVPNALIVMGGPHPTIYPAETVDIEVVDAVVRGEGEYVFAELVRARLEGRALEAVEGVLTKRNGANAALIASLRHIDELDRILPPARHLLDNSLYRSVMAKRARATTMMSSRGCPFQCSFCDRPQMGKVFRKRSARSVVEEMAQCVEEYGIGEIVFYDDTFTVDKQRVLDICDMLIERRLEVLWDIRSRVDCVTPQMLGRLREAGCARIHYGVESGSPRIQKVLEKNLDLGEVAEVFARTRKEGIEVLGYFMVGCPTETEEDVEKTIGLLRSLPMDYAHISIFTPFPGTELYEAALESGTLDRDRWREFARDPRPDLVPVHGFAAMSGEEVVESARRAYRAFYGRPGYLLRQLARVRSFREFWNKARVGAELLYNIR